MMRLKNLERIPHWALRQGDFRRAQTQWKTRKAYSEGKVSAHPSPLLRTQEPAWCKGGGVDKGGGKEHNGDEWKTSLPPMICQLKRQVGGELNARLQLEHQNYINTRDNTEGSEKACQGAPQGENRRRNKAKWEARSIGAEKAHSCRGRRLVSGWVDRKEKGAEKS